MPPVLRLYEDTLANDGAELALPVSVVTSIDPPG